MKPLRKHSDDFKRLAVEDGLAADDVRIAAEHPLPSAVADHRDVRWELGVFARDEQPPENRLDAERLEETLGDPAPINVSGWRPSR